MLKKVKFYANRNALIVTKAYSRSKHANKYVVIFLPRDKLRMILDERSVVKCLRKVVNHL